MRLPIPFALNKRFTHLLLAALVLLGATWLLISSESLPASNLRYHVSEWHRKAEEKLGRVKAATTTTTTGSMHTDTYRVDSKDSITSGETKHQTPPVSSSSTSGQNTASEHPIDHLIGEAQKEFDALAAKETKTLAEAARAYRQRRGRQPPPGFDKWYAFAHKHQAVMIEDLFDRIYHDLEPMWAIPAKQLREQAHGFDFRISVRNGNVTLETNIVKLWQDMWRDMFRSVQELLPDVDMPVNVMDESRMVVPWEDMKTYMEQASATRKLAPEEELVDEFQSLDYLDANPPPPLDGGFKSKGPYWTLAVAGCPPFSEAREARVVTDFTTPPPLSSKYPRHSYHGYVRNWTVAQSTCDNAHLQGLHGTFVEPVSTSTTKKFFPLFGGSKLSVNNEVLIPPPAYWTKDTLFSGGTGHGAPWEQKEDGLIWRGVASGGRNKIDTWPRFQRHRFVSMMNATAVQGKEVEDPSVAPNFVLPEPRAYNLSARSATPGALGTWMGAWSDVKLINLECFGFPKVAKGYCPYTEPYFEKGEKVPMAQQYNYKYLPDVDGNSFSGRYRGFLQSTSLPIKATIYSEWHDSRLVPWKHFVPMDMTFIDIYGIMEYFLGNAALGVPGHDAQARRIALDGMEWTQRVLRHEDMRIYIVRLVLEFARLCDDRREVMGWRETG